MAYEVPYHILLELECTMLSATHCSDTSVTTSRNKHEHSLLTDPERRDRTVPPPSNSPLQLATAVADRIWVGLLAVCPSSPPPRPPSKHPVARTGGCRRLPRLPRPRRTASRGEYALQRFPPAFVLVPHRLGICGGSPPLLDGKTAERAALEGARLQHGNQSRSAQVLAIHDAA